MHKTINPFKKDNLWMFTDKETGLVDELLVSGADDLCERICDKYHINKEQGFSVDFSDNEKEFNDPLILKYLCKPDSGGYLYIIDDQACWLCENLLQFFQKPPKTIYFSVKEARGLAEYQNVLKEKGLQLVYCKEFYLVENAVTEMSDEHTEKFCKKYPNIEWLDLNLVRLK